MSASPMARQATESKSIPIRRIINDHSELPSDYSTTPGGTLYSTTPGGTKIVYEKSLLLNLRSSPISRTPPKFHIPEVLQKDYAGPQNGAANPKPTKRPPPKRNAAKANHVNPNPIKEKAQFDDQDQFQMEI